MIRDNLDFSAILTRPKKVKRGFDSTYIIAHGIITLALKLLIYTFSRARTRNSLRLRAIQCDALALRARSV